MRLATPSKQASSTISYRVADMVAANCAGQAFQQDAKAPVFAFNVHAGAAPTFKAPAYMPLSQWHTDARGLTAARQVPKVPSMLFDMEDMMEESSRSGHEDVEVRHMAFRVQSLCRPTSVSSQVLADVECATRMAEVGDASHLAQALVSLGYPASSISIRHSLGGGDGGQCLRNLRHTFLCLALESDRPECTGPDSSATSLLRTLSASSMASNCSTSSSSSSTSSSGLGTSTTTIIIDPFFREQFEVPVASPLYTALVEALPAVYVGTQDHLVPIVEFMCEEMSRAFVEAGGLLPPWRRTKSMMSKWLPRRSCDLSLLQLVNQAAAPATATAGQAPDTSQQGLQLCPTQYLASGLPQDGLQPRKVSGGLSRALSGVPAGPGAAPGPTVGGHGGLSNALGHGFGRKTSPTRVLLEPMQRVVGGSFVTVPSGLAQ